jgi:uncharacterized repeat protein (TIGR01451 family)
MALSAFSKATNEPCVGKISVSQIFSDEKVQALALPAGKFPVTEFSEDADKLIFVGKEDRTAYYQVVQGGYELLLPQKSIKNSIEISRTYKNSKGSDIQKATLGEEIEVHLKFRSLNDQTLNDIAIVDLLPAGLEVSAGSVRNNNNGSWNPDYVDVREDRVIFYGTIRTKIQELVYKVRAINKGTYIVPPLYGESMYDRTIFGYSPNENFIVDNSGNYLQSFPVNTDGSSSSVSLSTTEPVQIPETAGTPVPTSTVDVTLNLPAGDAALDPAEFDPEDPATYNNATSVTIYDSLGESHVTSTYYVKPENASYTGTNQWVTFVTVDGEDSISGKNPCGGGRGIDCYFSNFGCIPAIRQPHKEKDKKEENKTEQKIKNRSGKNDQETLPHSFMSKRCVSITSRLFLFIGVFAKHLYVTAKWQST